MNCQDLLICALVLPIPKPDKTAIGQKEKEIFDSMKVIEALGLLGIRPRNHLFCFIPRLSYSNHMKGVRITNRPGDNIESYF
jgi:hypothetical protein